MQCSDIVFLHYIFYFILISSTRRWFCPLDRKHTKKISISYNNKPTWFSKWNYPIPRCNNTINSWTPYLRNKNRNSIWISTPSYPESKSQKHNETKPRPFDFIRILYVHIHNSTNDRLTRLSRGLHEKQSSPTLHTHHTSRKRLIRMIRDGRKIRSP